MKNAETIIEKNSEILFKNTFGKLKNSTRTPLRYPGGKGRLANFFALICEKNKISTYVEPYSGGCGIGIRLLQNAIVERVVINDIDPIIYSFWHSIIHSTDRFISKILDTPLTVQEWERQRHIIKNYKDYDNFTVGFATFYMNRCNRSGIINAGIIGGKAQNGKYNIASRFNKNSLIERIEKISKQKEKITLYNLDAVELIKNKIDTTNKNCLIYFDPPYYHKANTLYKNFYNQKDHEKIADFIKTLNTPYIVTYDNVEQIRRIYEGLQCFPFYLTYSASNKSRHGEELFIYNNFQIL